MNHSKKRLIQALAKQPVDRPPFWFMRQAGRYLPEYKELRSTTKSFLDFCYSPDKASEATLQPIHRFHMDAAIIFSDILVIPDALGVNVTFKPGVGPLLSPITKQSELDKLKPEQLTEKLLPVYEALRLTKKALPDDVALIGFAGAPWTLACYITEGKGSRDFQIPRCLSYQEPDFFSHLIEMLTDSVARHAIEQINAGAEVIQIFDSWSGVLSEAQFAQYSIQPTKKIVAAIKEAHPDVPVIGFARMAGSKLLEYVQQTGVDGASIDGSVSLAWARDNLQPLTVIQGNLDPIVLTQNKQEMLDQAKRILATFAKGHFVFNLGHGILPFTPIDHVEALCQLIKEHSS